MAGSFGEFVQTATGHAPYAYQQQIADHGLPELLEVPTGSGKTLAAVLPWLYRRRFHSEPSVQAVTPHWLVFVLPMRVLVEQTAHSVQEWVTKLGLADEVGVHVVMGGEGRTSISRCPSWRTSSGFAPSRTTERRHRGSPDRSEEPGEPSLNSDPHDRGR